MVRRRLVSSVESSNANGEGITVLSSHIRPNHDNKTKMLFLLFAAVSTVFVGFRVYLFYEIKHRADAVTQLADLLPASEPYDQLVWSSLRPQLYFGLRTRHPQSPLFGLLWYSQPRSRYIQSLPIRHWCDHDDNVRFLWEDSDGKSFGHQTVIDGDVQFTTDWFNHAGGSSGDRSFHSWSARVQRRDNANESLAFVFYMLVQDSTTRLNVINNWRDDVFDILRCVSPLFGDFSLLLRIRADNGKKPTSAVSWTAHVSTVDLTRISDVVLGSLRWGGGEGAELRLADEAFGEGVPQFVAVQVTLHGPSAIEIVYDMAQNVAPTTFDNIAFEERLAGFRRKFDERFPINNSDNHTVGLRHIGRTALSNLLGGIGYWHGEALMRSTAFTGQRPYGPLSLLSAVPSRAFFPRGFIWDEGFHNMLIAKFDPDLSLEIVASWLDTMNEAGYIPREMILGAEAQAKVPAEFLVQSDAVANPPVFFLLIDGLLKDLEFVIRRGAALRRLYPRLKRWYLWLRNTQSGPHPGTFRWRGRNVTTNEELNPKTLPSGLDDFPRASHPSDQEYHLDLRCWMAVASRVLRMLSEQSDDTTFTPIIEHDVAILHDAAALDRLHWSAAAGRYADFGRHSADVRLVKRRRRVPGSDGRPPEFVDYYRRHVQKPPELRLVDDANGYVALFPFLLKLIPAESPKLEIILRNLDDPEELWSPYGLRSLSKRSPYYMQRNTEHDPPYWRGAIWININYLALDALAFYARPDGSAPAAVRQRASQLHGRLRAALVATIAGEFRRTGFFWENYSDATGRGQGTRPFTGWTSLILIILAENDSVNNESKDA